MFQTSFTVRASSSHRHYQVWQLGIINLRTARIVWYRGIVGCMTITPSSPSYTGYRFPAEIISHAVWLYFRFPLSYRDVEELMAEHGIVLRDETIRQWCQKFGQQYANQLHRRRVQTGDKWHLDEVFLTINGKLHYLWRAVDQRGNVLDILVQSQRNKQAALKFFRKLLKGCQHSLAGKFDFVMANPPFNVDKIDKERIKDDSARFPFGMPTVDNGHYLWMQLFYAALNKTGRAGFVMANGASDARGSELEIRKKLIEAHAVDVMVAVSSNFFYTVTLPCTLWFFDKGKAKQTARSRCYSLMRATCIHKSIGRTASGRLPR